MDEQTPDAPARPDDVEPDPRTDGVGDGGARELDPPGDEDVARGFEVEREVHETARTRGVLVNDPDGEHVGHDHVAHDDDPQR
jgi:hypothetical protein